MAHKKGVGSSSNGRESESKRLGLRIFGGQKCVAGNIIVRQRGTVHNPGMNVQMGKDHTLFAVENGIVLFMKGRENRSTVHVVNEKVYGRYVELLNAEDNKLSKGSALRKAVIDTL